VKAEKRVAGVVHALQLQRSMQDKEVVGKKIAKPLYRLLDECEVETQSSSSSPKHKLEIKLLVVTQRTSNHTEL